MGTIDGARDRAGSRWLVPTVLVLAALLLAACDAVTPGGGPRYGDDPALDALWDACDDGDDAACDELTAAAPSGSEYARFGESCGARAPGADGCEGRPLGGDPEGPAPGEPDVYGDDPDLDALWDGCEAGDWEACDDLYRQSPIGSEYERFGDTCGDRNEPSGWCVDVQTDGPPAGEPDAYGDDATLDALWDGCEAGDFVACDDLYRDSPPGSAYERFGDTCGDRIEPDTWCVDVFGEG